MLLSYIKNTNHTKIFYSCFISTELFHYFINLIMLKIDLFNFFLNYKFLNRSVCIISSNIKLLDFIGLKTEYASTLCLSLLILNVGFIMVLKLCNIKFNFKHQNYKIPFGRKDFFL